ncbi:MAG: bifunctional N-acetylglucosamine-1-phosphate uridyltransferase/glucosamine-1-phosphate acetyltransferase [Magnetovibrio sp.]|nr:bifunctional N-acetylglucosamine-1-phosphate uridyltransferase/glucosamine-1-phosphate acetyltransferase [Magnetovibrio sp.]
MIKSKVAVIVLAAGLGTRMKSKKPKVLHSLGCRPMINHLMETVTGLDPDEVVVVVGDSMDDVSHAVSPFPTAVQSERLGTAHAVLAAREYILDFDGDILVLYGDTPLIKLETLEAMLDARASKLDPGVVVLGFTPDDPGNYGRLILSDDGTLHSIVEVKDATDEQLQIKICNSGVMAIDGKALCSLLDRVSTENATGEYYLTDIIQLAVKDGRTCVVLEGDEDELIGVNSRVELAKAEKIFQDRLRIQAMENGVSFTDPKTVFLCQDTKFGKDVQVGPNVLFGPGVTVGDGAVINAFCHIEGTEIMSKASVGPFARLRPGTKVSTGAKVGNFVEVKSTLLESNSKVSHLSYLGDAQIGEGANIGAGTITCNYDGFQKSQTIIGKSAFVGSNTALVAPVNIGAGAIVGAGSTITKDVKADALGITRAPQNTVFGWAKKKRKPKFPEKAPKKKK